LSGQGARRPRGAEPQGRHTGRRRRLSPTHCVVLEIRLHTSASIATIRAKLIALIRRQPLFAFYVIAFGWTWAFVIVFLILFPLPDIIVRTTPGDLGPTIAALVVTAVIAGRIGVRQLLKRIVQWRVGLVWYAFALIGVPMLYIARIAGGPGGSASS